MAILQISDISETVVQQYANASVEEQRQLAKVVEEIFLLLQTKSAPAKPVMMVNSGPRRNPFDTAFKAIKLRGEGPTGSEMVIQARR